MKYIAVVLLCCLASPTVYKLQAQEIDWKTLVLANNIEEVKDWVDSGGDVNARDADGGTVLMWATLAGDLNLLKYLLEQGADPSQKGIIWLDAQKSGSYGNLLGIASSRGHIEILRHLIDIVGLDPEDRELNPETGEHNGWRALQWAAYTHQEEAVAYLLEVGASADHALDSEAPIILATVSVGIVKLLYEAGASLLATGSQGETLLHHLAATDEAWLASHVIDSGVDVDATIQEVLTPLLIAAKLGKELMARLLICRGAYLHYNEAVSLARTDGHSRTALVLNKGCDEEALAPLMKAQQMNSEAFELQRNGQYALAVENAAEALRIRSEFLEAYHPDYGQSVSNLAYLYFEQGLYSDAEPLFKEALDVTMKMYSSEPREYATALSNLASLYEAQGRFQEVESLLQESLEVTEQVLGNKHPDYARGLNNLATYYRSQGRFIESESLLKEALSIVSNVSGHPALDYATFIANLAVIYTNQGRLGEAETQYNKSLEIMEEALLTSHPRFALNLHNLAALYQLQYRYEEAELLFKRAMEVIQLELGEDHPEYGYMLSNLSALYEAQGRYDEAEPYLLQAINIIGATQGKTHPTYARILSTLAMLYRSQGRLEDTERVIRESLAVLDLDSNRNLEPMVRVLAGSEISWILYSQGRQEEAKFKLNEAIDTLEKQRTQVSSSSAFRAKFLQDNSAMYAKMIEWLVADGNYSDALNYLERSRARNFLDQLASTRIDIRASIPEPSRSRLIEQEQSAQALIAELNQRILFTQANDVLDDARREELIQELSMERANALDHFASVYNDIKNASELYQHTIARQLNFPSVDSLRTTVIPEDGYLLSYLVGARTINDGRVPGFVFGVSQSDVWVEPLLSNGEPLTENMLDSLLFADEAATVSGLRRTDVIATDNRLRIERLHTLYQTLIPETRRQEIMASRELLVVPDANLHALPFEALVVDTTSENGEMTYWIDEGPLLRYAPSATVLHNITIDAMDEDRQLASHRSEGLPKVLTLSDPVYDAAQVDSTAFASYKRSEYNRRAGSYEVLPRLPGTSLETDYIVAAYGEGTEEAVKVLRRSEASEAALRQHLAGNKYVHIATHGLTEVRREGSEGLFSSLVLTPPPEGITEGSENDGYLELREIYEMGNVLVGTELAVLSACETNVGPQYRGEGAFALSRGFMAVGAQNVIASQWQVDDISTGRLVGTFFEEILKGEQVGDVDYAAALRKAQLAVKNDEENDWLDPFYWASFILIGTN